MAMSGTDWLEVPTNLPYIRETYAYIKENRLHL